MKLLNSRAFSFLLIALIYIVAGAAGIISYVYLPFEPWLSLLVADIIATVVTFIFSVIFNNASVYDPYWSVAPIVIAVALAATAPKLTAVHILPLIAVCIWGTRLTANWAYTFMNMYHQDWRYTMLKQQTKALYPVVNLLGIHLFPTLVVYACILPVVYTFIYAPTLNVGAVIGFVISLGAVTLQGTSDYLMHRFRKAKTGGFIRTGTWKYSRHPNYLGEILMWWGIAIAFVSMMPSMWYLAAGALINTLMFLFVSVPLADRRNSRREGFAEYKAATRMLLPIYKKQPL
ncbi:MAG: DUF1295 domain-containing protein [Clostridia bacterium]|nr:DUF1295 domain-containing protein [Clostridia bacterium]